MAFTFDTVGFDVSPAFLGQGNLPLAQLQPLQFAGKNFSPSPIYKEYAIPVDRTQVALAGVGSALGEIGKGVVAYYQDKQDRQDKAEETAQKFDRDIILAKIRASGSPTSDALKDAKLQADIDLTRARVKAVTEGVGTNGGLFSRKAPRRFGRPQDQTPALTPQQQEAENLLNQNQGDRIDENGEEVLPSIEPPLPTPESEVDGLNLGEEAPGITNPDGSLDIFTGTETSRIKSPRDNALDALSSSLSGISPVYLSAQADGGINTPPAPLGSIPLPSVDISSPTGGREPGQDWLGPKPTRLASPTGGAFEASIVPETMPLETMPPVSSQAKIPVGGGAPPRQDQPQAEVEPPVVDEFPSQKEANAEARREIPGYRQGKVEKIYDDSGTPWYKVTRDLLDPAAVEAAKLREERVANTKQARIQSLMLAESREYYNSPDIKAFHSPNGMRQSFPKFVKDYDHITKNPQGAGISDIGLVDMFARAEAGGRVTEAQAHLALNAMTLQDKVKTLLNQKLQGGDQLSQTQRDQMLEVIADDYEAQVNIANQQVTKSRNKLKKAGASDDELPDYYILPELRSRTKEKLNELRTEGVALFNQKRQQPNGESVSTIDERLKEIEMEAKELAKKLQSSKGAILNMHELETQVQGWKGVTQSDIYGAQ